MYKLSKNSKKRLQGINVDLIELIHRSITLSPHDFGIPKYGGLRTSDEQFELYNKRPKVTTLDGFIKRSYHQSGNAFDIYLYDEHGACWSCKWKYYEIAKHIKDNFECMKEEGYFKNKELTWGGDWQNFPDLPHFEIREDV